LRLSCPFELRVQQRLGFKQNGKVHARYASPGRSQSPLKTNGIDFADLVKRLAAHNYPGWYAIEYVWIDWEHGNEVDNVSETILLRGILEAAARAAA
jgi:hypothetical protein